MTFVKATGSLRLDYLRTRIASWWMPDDVVFIEEMPMTATGKIRKTSLREKFEGCVLPEKQSSSRPQQPPQRSG